MSFNDISANFSLNNNENINATFDVPEAANFDALFYIESELQVKGEGLINVVTADGTATVSSKTYIHEQGIASDTWIINHNLNKYPSVTIVDSAGNKFFAQVNYTDENNCTVYMNGATTGKAYLN